MPEPTFWRIVVGVDGSSSRRHALRRASDEAFAHDATLEVVMAWSRRRPSTLVHVDNDLPARALLAAANGAWLVVIGGRGVGGFTGLLLGSVGNQIAHHAGAKSSLRRVTAPSAIAMSADVRCEPALGPMRAHDRLSEERSVSESAS